MSELKELCLLVLMQSPDGKTSEELIDTLQRKYGIDTYHGPVSGALTNLHASQEVFSLKETRNGMHPYFHKKFRLNYPPSSRKDLPRKSKWRSVADSLYEALVDLDLNSPLKTSALKKYEELSTNDFS